MDPQALPRSARRCGDKKITTRTLFPSVKSDFLVYLICPPQSVRMIVVQEENKNSETQKKKNILPRQALEKHRESTPKIYDAVFGPTSFIAGASAGRENGIFCAIYI